MRKHVFSFSLVVLFSANAALAEVKTPIVATPDKPESPSESTLISIGAPDAGTLGIPQAQALNARVIANFTGRKYRLGPNDILNVSVYDSPEFSQENLLVMPDGSINIAPFGGINVAGMTVEELQADITERLRTYLNDPRVTIRMEHTKPFEVYISGAVLRPGAYEMVTDPARMNQVINNAAPGVLVERKTPLLSNILVVAGGLRYDADLEHVRIRNKFDGSSYEVNLLDLISQGNSDQDMFLIAGDSVEVPALSSPFAVDEEKYKKLLGTSVFQREVPVKIYGFVNRPGLVMLDSAQSANLNSAIGAAGGFLSTQGMDSAYSPSKVYISRVDGNGHMATVAINPRKEDMALRPNDIVYVPSKPIPTAGRAFDFLSRVVAPLAGIANGYNNWALLFDPTRFNVNVSTR